MLTPDEAYSRAKDICPDKEIDKNYTLLSKYGPYNCVYIFYIKTEKGHDRSKSDIPYGSPIVIDKDSGKSLPYAAVLAGTIKEHGIRGTIKQ